MRELQRNINNTRKREGMRDREGERERDIETRKRFTKKRLE